MEILFLTTIIAILSLGFKFSLSEKTFTPYIDTLNDISFIVNPGERICARDQLLIAAFIPSAVDNNEKRLALRQTWARRQEKIRFVFVLGISFNNSILNSKIIEESNQYGDIVQGDFLDTYQNLTLKTIFGLKWMSLYCQSARFLMKVDDDIVVNTYLLLNYFQSNLPTQATMFGRVYDKAYPFRNKDYKWYVSYEEYAGDFYPTFCAGKAYLMTNDLTSKMVESTKFVKPFIFEDVYVGMLAEYLKISFKKIAEFMFFNDYFKKEKAMFVLTNNLNEFEHVWKIIFS
jgi:beta-1,3-galactosyltransferase 2